MVEMLGDNVMDGCKRKLRYSPTPIRSEACSIQETATNNGKTKRVYKLMEIIFILKRYLLNKKGIVYECL